MSYQPSGNPQPSELRLRTCPSCGAALPGSSGRVECAYCGTVIEFRNNAAGSAQSRSRQSTTKVQRTSPGRGATQIGGFMGMAGALMTVVILGIVVLLFVQTLPSVTNVLDVPEPTRSATQNPEVQAPEDVELTSTTTMLVLPLDDAPRGRQPRTVALVRSRADQRYHLALLDLATQQRLWIGPPLSENAYSSAQMAASNDTVAFVDDRTLRGFALRDGLQRWTSTLSDRVCDHCLLMMKKVAVALSVDDMLTGVDLSTGERLWSVDLGKYAGQQVLALDDQVLVFNQDAASHGQVALIDPLSGNVVRHVTPACDGKTFPDQQIYMNAGDTNWLSRDRQTLIVMSNSTDTCIHAYDLASGAQRWQTVLDDRIVLRDSAFVTNGGELLLGNQSQIMAIDQANGSLTVVSSDEDYAFRPLLVRDGVLATIAVKQRGTERIELWGVDRQSGKRLWRHEFAGDGKMFEPPYQAYGTIDDTQQLWTLSDTAAGMVLTTLTAKPHRFVFELLDTRSGQVTATKTLDLPAADTVWAPRVVARIDDLIYFDDQSRLFAIDVTKGIITYQGP